MTLPGGTSHAARAWEVSFAHGDLLVWFRWGGTSLWIDTSVNRLEVNGRSFLGWMGHRDPVESFQGLPIREMSPAVDPEVAKAIHPLGAHGDRSGLAALGLLILAGLGLLAVPPGGLQRLLGGLAVLLGARLRGAAGMGFALLILALAQRAGLPTWGLAALILGLLVSQSLGARRVAYPLAAAGGLSWGDPVFSLVWFGLAVAGGAWELRPRRLDLPLGGEQAWRHHCLSAVVARLEDPELWTLDQRDPEGLPPAPGYRSESRWRVLGRTPVQALGDDHQRWVFLPGVLAVIQAGVEVRLHRMDQVRMEGRPCTWEGGPPGLGRTSWILTLQVGGDVLRLLFGRPEAGQAMQEGLDPWVQASGQAPSPPPTSPLLEALALLGLGPQATPADIKRAYHREVRRVHPDHHPGVSGEAKAALEARLRALNEAMGLLRSRL